MQVYYYKLCLVTTSQTSCFQKSGMHPKHTQKFQKKFADLPYLIEDAFQISFGKN